MLLSAFALSFAAAMLVGGWLLVRAVRDVISIDVPPGIDDASPGEIDEWRRCAEREGLL